jgi:hypothetical protein
MFEGHTICYSKVRRGLGKGSEWRVSGWAIPPQSVDDDKVNRRILSIFLQVFGCTMDIAVDGVGAVEGINLEKYDLVLMVSFLSIFISSLIILMTWTRVRVLVGYRHTKTGWYICDATTVLLSPLPLSSERRRIRKIHQPRKQPTRKDRAADECEDYSCRG